MKCIYCDAESTRVVDTRETSEKVRRRRECSECERRFTTYETAENLDIQVVKRSGEKQGFDESKIRGGVKRAVEKTPVGDEDVEEIVEKVKKQVRGKKEVKSEQIGKIVQDALKEKDEVAYMRFASVYESFDDIESFKKKAEALEAEQK
ncbi:MAG: transcriptional regulator NrdR [Candidatus Nanohaloarchaea archaeon]